MLQPAGKMSFHKNRGVGFYPGVGVYPVFDGTFCTMSAVELRHVTHQPNVCLDLFALLTISISVYASDQGRFIQFRATAFAVHVLVLYAYRLELRQTRSSLEPGVLCGINVCHELGTFAEQKR